MKWRLPASRRLPKLPPTPAPAPRRAVATSAQVLDLPHAAAALEYYDAYDCQTAVLKASNNTQLYAALYEEELREAGVGFAFWLDTSHVNSLERCLQCVHPGEHNPSPGTELSWVRRLVARWKETQ